MSRSNQLGNDFIMAPVPQEVELIELNWEQLEGIQGGGWFKKAKKIVRDFFKSLDGRTITVYRAGADQSQYDDKFR